MEFSAVTQAKVVRAHTPNHIPLKERLGCCAAISLYVFLCYLGFIEGKVYVPGGRHSPGWYVSGPSGFWLAEFSHWCMIASLAVIVVDHFDKRANELSYKWWNRAFIIAALAFAVLALFLGKVERRKRGANQSSEPTPTSVTPRADARVAPAAVVAHL